MEEAATAAVASQRIQAMNMSNSGHHLTAMIAVHIHRLMAQAWQQQQQHQQQKQWRRHAQWG